MKAPFNDLKREYHSIKDDIDNAIREVVENTAFIKGKYLRDFEEAFQKYNPINHAIGASSGTTALHLAMMGFGIGPGDEVITVSHTFIGTSEPVNHAGASIKLIDIDPVYYTLDPNKIEEAITTKTKAIMPVHLYGQIADMESICSIAKKHELVVIEDAAQAIGAKYKGHRVGHYGDAACFSFYPGKNMGAYGDAGMVITNNDAAAKKMRMLLDHGRLTKYTHEMEGFNYRLDALQAAILQVKLKHIDSWNDARRKVAEYYCEHLNDLDIVLPVEAEDTKHIYHIFCIRVKNRDEVQKKLADAGVATGIHYPVPLHLQPAYAHLPYENGDMPETEKCADEILSLPMFPFITKAEMQHVVDSVRKVVNEVSSKKATAEVQYE